MRTITCTTKIEELTQNTAESYKKTKEKPTSSSSVTSIVCQKVDNKLKNNNSYEMIIRYVGHRTTDSNNRCLLTAEKI